MLSLRRSTALMTVIIVLFTAAMAFASSGEHGGAEHHVNWVYVGSLIFNFVAVLVLLTILLKKPVSGFLAARAEEVTDALAAADKARQSARDKIEEYGKKIDELMATREEVIAKSRKEAEYEHHRIVGAAKRLAERIVEEAGKSAQSEFDKASRKLLEETTAEIVTKAEGILKEALTKEDDVRLSDDYIEMLREVKR